MQHAWTKACCLTLCAGPLPLFIPCRHDMGRRTLAHTKRLIAYVLDRWVHYGSPCNAGDLQLEIDCIMWEPCMLAYVEAPGC